MLTNLKDMTKEDILNAMGLQTRKEPSTYVAPIVGIFGTGILVGVGLGLLLAPKAGRELRRNMSERFREMRGAARHDDSAESKDDYVAGAMGRRDRDQQDRERQQKRETPRTEASH